MAKKPIKKNKKNTGVKPPPKNNIIILLWYKGESLLEIAYQYPILRCPHIMWAKQLLLHQNNSECWYKGYEKKKTHIHTSLRGCWAVLKDIPPFSSCLMQGT